MSGGIAEDRFEDGAAPARTSFVASSSDRSMSRRTWELLEVHRPVRIIPDRVARNYV